VVRAILAQSLAKTRRVVVMVILTVGSVTIAHYQEDKERDRGDREKNRSVVQREEGGREGRGGGGGDTIKIVHLKLSCQIVPFTLTIVRQTI
jgi:hypothetical protein